MNSASSLQETVQENSMKSKHSIVKREGANGAGKSSMHSTSNLPTY